ncbi:MAG: hypothetical protein KA347_10885 [Bacteroidia bacterium]|nr:hypothetical protein [Bacteroidia bacterium]
MTEETAINLIVCIDARMQEVHKLNMANWRKLEMIDEMITSLNELIIVDEKNSARYVVKIMDLQSDTRHLKNGN